MLLSQWYLVRIASNSFISIGYRKFLFNLIKSFKFNCVLLLRKTIIRQRNPLIVFCRMMQVPVYCLWQWRGRSEAAAGGAALLMAPPASHTFLPLSLGCVSCRRHKGHCAVNLGGWGRYKPRSSSMVKSWWRSKRFATWKLQRICILWYLNPGLLLPNSTWMVMLFSCTLQ